MADGRMVEMATVGNEGLVGIAACFGGGLEPGEALVQVPNGSAQVLDVAVFTREGSDPASGRSSGSASHGS